MGKNYNKLSKKEYERIRALTGAGLKNSVIASVTGRSTGTVNLIRKFEDMEDYLRYQREQRYKYGGAKKPNTEAVKPEEVATEKVDHSELIRTINNNTEAVITMTSVMNKIVDQNAEATSFWRRK